MTSPQAKIRSGVVRDDQPAINAAIGEIDTPALLVDLDLLEENIEGMAQYFREVDAELRPHVKTHKCCEIALRQIDAGAIGVTCQRLVEAEVMADAGIKSILISNQVVGKRKIERLLDLCDQSEVMIAVDNPLNVKALSRAATARGIELGLLVEVDLGMNRCGVGPGKPGLDLTRKVLACQGLEFKGLMGYEGHVVGTRDQAKRTEGCLNAMRKLLDTKRLLEDSGIDVHIVSAGGTGTYNITGEYPEVTEVQAGSYVFMDTWYGSLEGLNFKYALTVLATVISRPARGRGIIDAGLKAISNDHGLPEVKGLGGATLTGLFEEHGNLKLEGKARNLKVGDKVEVIPSHCCTTTNLHNELIGVKRGSVKVVWPVAARGRFR